MNSEFTTIRSLIVLVFLVGLPAVAIMPEGVQGALKGIWPEKEPAPESSSLPMINPTTELGGFPMVPTTHAPEPALPPATPVGQMTSFDRPPMSREPEFKPASFEVASEVVGQRQERLAFPSPASEMSSDLPLPSDRLTPPEGDDFGLVSRGTQDLQTELDRLGATYYRLESWGNSPRVYRFHCTVAINIGQSEYSQRFEATGESPMAAMRQVHTEVAEWHKRFSALSHSDTIHEMPQ
ncbi:hypothetical protein [Bremerella cremea]|uniref:hypothetical protein n=1 Tax=Bremerella cremea TaxID=1031537 RepID=UPI0031E99D07